MNYISDDKLTIYILNIHVSTIDISLQLREVKFYIYHNKNSC